MAISRDLGRVRMRAQDHFEAEIRGIRLTQVSARISSQIARYEHLKFHKNPEKSKTIIVNRGCAAIFDDLFGFL